MSREQKLVNSQIEVNRAVFLMNARNNRQPPEYSGVDASDDEICLHIDSAIQALTAAREGYLRQMEFAFANKALDEDSQKAGHPSA
jgi:hypothetical protein